MFESGVGKAVVIHSTDIGKFCHRRRCICQEKLD